MAIAFGRPTATLQQLMIQGYDRDFHKHGYRYFTERDLFFTEDGYLFINSELMICLYQQMELPDAL